MKGIILAKKELVDLYPGKQNAYQCTMLGTDNSKYEATIPKKECELMMYLSFLKPKLSQSSLDKLKEFIDDYGQEKYDSGYENGSSDEAESNAQDNAGADL